MRIKKLFNEIVKNTVLVTVSVLITLFIAEFILRQTEIGNYSLNDRVLFYTNPSFVMGEDRAVKYAPNSKIRSVAIYGNHVDYDVTNYTNSMGFIDNISYSKTKSHIKNIVFIGDSFTAGSGSNNPWVGQVRKFLGLSDVKVYNLGVGGTGIHHFYNLLKSSEGIIPFEEVNIMVISNDFFRRFWYPYVEGNGLWFCKTSPKNNCPNRKHPIIYIADHSESEADLLARAEKIYMEKKKNRDGTLKYHQKLRLYNLFCDAYGTKVHTKSLESICPHLKVYKATKYTKNEAYTEAIEMLRVMLAEFPGVKFRLFHIPEKGDVFTGQYSLSVEDDIKELDLEYIPLLQTCNWKISMYHKHDAHPNDSGYYNLAKCMTEYIK